MALQVISCRDQNEEANNNIIFAFPIFSTVLEISKISYLL
jgi:hypothetical protein